jgi:hypothetical protein
MGSAESDRNERDAGSSLVPRLEGVESSGTPSQLEWTPFLQAGNDEQPKSMHSASTRHAVEKLTHW